MIVLGDSGRNIKFEIPSSGDVNVTGALTLMTDYDDYDTKIELLVDNDLQVDGLLTSFASIQQVEFKGGSDARVYGSFLLGRPIDGGAKEMKPKFESDFEAVKDDAKLEVALDELQKLGMDIKNGSTSGSSGGAGTLTSYSWRRVQAGGGY